MPPRRCPWLGLVLLALLSLPCGCALRGVQPAPHHVPPPHTCAALAPGAFWGLSGDQGMLIGAYLGCLAALALLWRSGQRRRGRRARPRRQSPPLVLLARLRFLRWEINKLMAQGRRQAQVVELVSRRRAGHQPPPGRGQGGL
ncbi:MAG: hypothetical protein HY910_06690 [Desulfarculus sp.]|nr:hypothetical protein [Desulfarculus sp.]